MLCSWLLWSWLLWSLWSFLLLNLRVHIPAKEGDILHDTTAPGFYTCTHTYTYIEELYHQSWCYCTDNHCPLLLQLSIIVVFSPHFFRTHTHAPTHTHTLTLISLAAHCKLLALYRLSKPDRKRTWRSYVHVVALIWTCDIYLCVIFSHHIFTILHIGNKEDAQSENMDGSILKNNQIKKIIIKRKKLKYRKKVKKIKK